MSKTLRFGLKSLWHQGSHKETPGMVSTTGKVSINPIRSNICPAQGLGAKEALAGDTNELLSPNSPSLVGSP